MWGQQARRQDNVTGGGGRNKFWGAREVYLCEFERGTGARDIYSSVDQTKKVKTKKKRGSRTRALKTRVLKTRALKDTSPKGHES